MLLLIKLFYPELLNFDTKLKSCFKKHEVKFCIGKKRNCRDAFGFRSEVLATSILTRASVCCKIAFFIMHWYRIKVLPCFSSKSLKLPERRAFKWRTFESFTSSNTMNMKNQRWKLWISCIWIFKAEVSSTFFYVITFYYILCPRQ